MFTVRYDFRLDQGAINQVLKSEGGLVGQWGTTRARRATIIAKKLSPVYTGAMRDSISTRTIRGDELSWEITVNVPYAKYVIEGPSAPGPKSPNDFLDRAAREAFGT